MVIPLHNNGLSRWSIWVFQVADQRYWSTTRIDTQNVVSFTNSHSTVARSHSTAARDMAGVYLKMHNVLVEIIVYALMQLLWFINKLTFCQRTVYAQNVLRVSYDRCGL